MDSSSLGRAFGGIISFLVAAVMVLIAIVAVLLVSIGWGWLSSTSRADFESEAISHGVAESFQTQNGEMVFRWKNLFREVNDARQEGFRDGLRKATVTLWQEMKDGNWVRVPDGELVPVPERMPAQ